MKKYLLKFFFIMFFLYPVPAFCGELEKPEVGVETNSQILKRLVEAQPLPHRRSKRASSRSPHQSLIAKIEKAQTLLNQRGVTLPMAAAFIGNIQIIKLLEKKGYDFSLRGKEGANPLMYAAMGGQWTVVHYLMEIGNNPRLKDDKRETALEYADKGSIDLSPIVVPLHKRSKKSHLIGAEDPLSSQVAGKESLREALESSPPLNEDLQPSSDYPSPYLYLDYLVKTIKENHNTSSSTARKPFAARKAAQEILRVLYGYVYPLSKSVAQPGTQRNSILRAIAFAALVLPKEDTIKTLWRAQFHGATAQEQNHFLAVYLLYKYTLLSLNNKKGTLRSVDGVNERLLKLKEKGLFLNSSQRARFKDLINICLQRYEKGLWMPIKELYEIMLKFWTDQ